MNPDWTWPDSAIVRFFHGVPDYEQIEVGMVSESITYTFSAVEFSKASPYLGIVPDDYGITVTSGGSTVFSDTLSFATGKRYTVVVYDEIKKLEDD